MAEDRDYIEEAQQEAQLRFGKELSAQELATEFAKHDPEARIHHLKTLRDDGEVSVRDAAKMLEFRSALRSTHEILRKANR
jgi:hypothetical protein